MLLTTCNIILKKFYCQWKPTQSEHADPLGIIDVCRYIDLAFWVFVEFQTTHQTSTMNEFIQAMWPIWLKKLPTNIQYFIIGFIGLHLLALIIVGLMHLTSKKTPDFQAKIK